MANAAATAGKIVEEDVPSFATEGLTYSVGDKVLLHPTTIAFRPGEVSALVGHNGSGKSTLLKLLARQLDPSGGVARFGEQDRTKVEEALRLTHIEHLSDRLVDTLSGGERQRVWIAMLVAQDSRCLLLDEPTSALDVAHQIEVLSLVRDLSHAKGLGVVVVLHDINMAARFCDRIFALKGGHFIAEGAPGEVMKAETLKDIYGVAMDILPNPVTGAPIAYVI